jgi:hypothetical protein
MSWLCVLNPSKATFERVKPLLIQAHQMALKGYAKRGGTP